MSEQAPLFGDLWRQTAPKAMPETAIREARESIESRIGPMHREILDLLAEHGPLTDEEMQARMMIGGSTQRPRRRELEQMARIRPAGEGRTASGRRATKWGLP